MTSTSNIDKGPWRDVAYIGTSIGDLGGRAWRLVLDGCGHTEYRKQPPISLHHTMTRRLTLAPHRVRCTSCAAGVPSFDVTAAVELAQRVDDTP
jgi:hypothetical protein